MTGETFDVAVIGAGVVGAAIARELSRYRLRCALLEAADDVGTGTSKANTALLHTGFDARPGSLEAQLVRRGHELLSAYAPQAGIALEHIGALLVAWNAEQLNALPDIAANAVRNAYTRVRHVSAAELYATEPHLGAGALGALAIPDECIICPFTTPLAFATEAVMNAVELALQSPVHAVRRNDGETYTLLTPSRPVRCRYVINAAGLYADDIDRLFDHQDFTVTPRRGELIVFDKLARPLVTHILLPVPTKVSKGVLVSPTVFGNVMLGPTAEDILDKSATDSTGPGIASLCDRGRHIVPVLFDEQVTAVYVGLRAATEHADYRITFHPAQRYVSVGGIRSTGLSASMAIAEYVVSGLKEAGAARTAASRTGTGLRLELKDEFHPVRMPNIGEAFTRPYQNAEMIALNPDYGRIMCHCERVTRGEILAAARSTIPARTIDGLRRRTRALLGRCQGFYCGAAVTRLLAEATGHSVAEQLQMRQP